MDSKTLLERGHNLYLQIKHITDIAVLIIFLTWERSREDGHFKLVSSYESNILPAKQFTVVFRMGEKMLYRQDVRWSGVDELIENLKIICDTAHFIRCAVLDQNQALNVLVVASWTILQVICMNRMKLSVPLQLVLFSECIHTALNKGRFKDQMRMT